MTKPAKTHLYEGGKYTRCGRPPTVKTAPKMADVTCQQCISPPRPFTTTNFDR